ncbi:transcriptional regulator [Candidatus Saccharibacteria bacterium]|nr:transcriptional regulator [Candidatus Saccharibacteria bacterium]MBR3323769.1 transcriptional regulator [Candidatus Saccharibacteria bacterium]
MSKENNTPVEKLFGSKTRTKLLGLFFENPDKSYYVREITRVIGEQINSVRRELLNLDSIGIIKNETYDNKVYYSANTKHPFCRPLIEMFSTKVDLAKDKDIRRGSWSDYTKPIKKYLKVLVVTNRQPMEEGIDLLIVGDDKTKKLSHWAEMIEKKKGKPLNYVIMSTDDFLYRQSVKDRYILDIFDMDISDIIDPDKLISGKE